MEGRGRVVRGPWGEEGRYVFGRLRRAAALPSGAYVCADRGRTPEPGELVLAEHGGRRRLERFASAPGPAAGRVVGVVVAYLVDPVAS